MGKFSRLGNDLYNGKKSIDFVGRRWLWYTGSLLIILVCVGGLYFKGLNWGIEFTGGAEYKVTLPASQVTQDHGRRPARGGREHRHRQRVVAGGHHHRQRGHPGPDRAAHLRRERPGHGRHPARRRVPPRRISPSPRSGQLGQGGRAARPARSGRLPGARGPLHLGLLPPVEDVRGRPRRAGPRRRHHHRHLRPLRLRGQSGDRHRHPDHPGLLALRHRRGLRQGAREHQGPAGHPPDVRRGGQPGGQPDAGPVDQHLDRRADPGRLHPVRRRRPARLRLDEGPRAGAVRRHGGRCLLLGVHRHAAAGAPQERRDRGDRGREAGEGPASRPGRPVRLRPVVQGRHADPGRAGCRSARRPGRPAAEPVATRPPSAPAASGRGRVVPPPRSEVKPSGAAGRQQPTRQPKSKRGKK